jgi:hypothetical protein
MALHVERITLGNAEADRALAAAVRELGAPIDEEWTASVMASPQGAWEAVLEGAPRPKAEHIDWEIVEAADRARYRKLFQGPRECRLEHVRRCLRTLLWASIRFADNPINSVSPALAQAFEDAVWDLLRDQDMNPVQVRFGLWRELSETRFVCKVEYATRPSPWPRLPWLWRSPLLRTPQDLRGQLQRALVTRRRNVPASLRLYLQKRGA